jgi:hypothetical protein
MGKKSKEVEEVEEVVNEDDNSMETQATSKKGKKKHMVNDEDEDENQDENQDHKDRKKDKKKKHKKVEENNEENEEEDEGEKKKKKKKKHKKEKKHDSDDEDDVNTDDEDMEKVKIKMLKNLKYDFASYEIKYIYETYLKHEGEINLSPSYQREFAWSNDKQDLFIDSVMNNYIIPPIILIKLTDKKGFRYECMDGQHRLTVLKHFIEGRPINPDDPHYIKYNKIEDGKKLNIFYEKKKRFDDIKDKRFLTDSERNIFNDKKIIIIKISNYDSKLTNLFSSIKNEMFLRLQKGERVGGTDVIRNCEHPLILELKKRGLISFRTYDEEVDETEEEVEVEADEEHEDSEDKDSNEENEEVENKDEEKQEVIPNHFNKLKYIMELKTKKVSQRLTGYLFFILKGVLVAKLSSLDIGTLTEPKIRDDILNSKTLRYTLKAGQNWNIYIDMVNIFINDINKCLKDKVSQYLLLLLFYNYVNEKEVYAKIIADKNLDRVKNKFNNEYFKTLFSFKEGIKVKKFFEGKRLLSAQATLKSFLEIK